jgi:PST family polysaccharide transporter
MDGLRERIFRATLAQGGMALLGKLANLGLSILLARLLFPEDYGLAAIALVLAALATLLGNFGFQSYLIQSRDVAQAEIDSCYTLNTIFSLLLGMVIAVAGQLWPGLPPTLRWMLALYGLQVVVMGQAQVQLALLKRQLDFRRSGQAELANTVVSASGRVAFALAQYGALCFPLGDLLGALARLLIARRMGGPRPRLLPLSTLSARGPLRFGLHSTSIGLASFFANQTDKLLLAAAFPVASVGLYAFSGNAAAMFYNAFIVPQTSVFLAAFSRLREDVDAARGYLMDSTRLVFSLALPVNLLLLLETERVLLVVFTEKWLPAAPLVQLLALDFVVRSMFTGITSLQLSFGLAAAAARTKWINATIIVACLASAYLMQLPLYGYALAGLAGNLLATFHNVLVNGRLLQLRWLRYFGNLLPPAAVALAATLAWYLARPLWAGNPDLVQLLASSALWLLAYALLTLAFNRMAVAVLLKAARTLSGQRDRRP